MGQDNIGTDSPGKGSLLFSIEPFDHPDWVTFLENHPEAHIFHHPMWVGFLARCYGYRPFLALVRDADRSIVAGLPLMEISLFNKNPRWVSLPFTDYCPPLFLDRTSLKRLETGLIAESRRNHVKGMELRWEFPSEDLYKSHEHVLTVTQLTQDPAHIRRQIKGNDFRKVNLGGRRGITIEKSASLDAMRKFYRLHMETRRRLGMPVQPWRFFELLLEEIIAPGNGFISLARRNEDYLAGIVFLKWKNTLIYKFSATSQTGRNLAASYPLTWDAIQWGCENHFSLLDWGRSEVGDEGLRDFKKRWASDERPLVYSKSSPGIQSILQRIQPVMSAVINQSPLWVCRLSGELFYRYLG